MNISSMTGFARLDGEIKSAEIVFNRLWEIKSVNGKSLEIKTRLPSAFEDIAPQLKNIASRYLNRGSIGVYLELKSEAHQDIKINKLLLDELSKTAITLYKENMEFFAKPEIGSLLQIKGVVENGENVFSEDVLKALKERLLSDFEELCSKLKDDREAEGAKIKIALEQILKEISQQVGEVVSIGEALPERLKYRLEEQVARWLEPGQAISEERLAQELVLYVNRADIKEECDRLQAHIKTAEELLNNGGAVGRRLDFLCQELNREANTTCSKACEIELTNIGMKLKALIEQFREQVQNIE